MGVLLPPFVFPRVAGGWGAPGRPGIGWGNLRGGRWRALAGPAIRIRPADGSIGAGCRAPPAGRFYAACSLSSCGDARQGTGRGHGSPRRTSRRTRAVGAAGPVVLGRRRALRSPETAAADSPSPPVAVAALAPSVAWALGGRPHGSTSSRRRCPSARGDPGDPPPQPRPTETRLRRRGRETQTQEGGEREVFARRAARRPFSVRSPWRGQALRACHASARASAPLARLGVRLRRWGLWPRGVRGGPCGAPRALPAVPRVGSGRPRRRLRLGRRIWPLAPPRRALHSGCVDGMGRPGPAGPAGPAWFSFTGVSSLGRTPLPPSLPPSGRRVSRRWGPTGGWDREG